jgi:hydrogenase-4 membrane subunit HyfE
MNITPVEFVVTGAAVGAVLMAGSSHIRTNLWFYTVQTLLIALASALTAHARADAGLYLIAAAIAILKGIGVPAFLSYIINRLKISRDSGMIVPAPLAMPGWWARMARNHGCRLAVVHRYRFDVDAQSRG